MNKILVEVSVGELLDKISILEIKKEKIKDKDNLSYINDEYSVLKIQLENNIKMDDKLKDLFISLKQVNNKLWGIENEKRLYERNNVTKF